MRRNEKGQVIIIVAVLLVVVLIVLALIIDGSRILVEQQELNRAADAAGKAGLIIVGDQMVTQVIGAQTAASFTLTATPIGSTPGPTLTSTPAADDFFSWLNQDHKETLVAPPMQTLVATHVLGSAEENGFGFGNPEVTGLEISYPDGYQPGDHSIQISVRIDRLVVVIFGNLLNSKEGVLSGKTLQSIP